MTAPGNDSVHDSPGPAATGPAETPRGTRAAPSDTASDTWRSERTFREAPQQELMDLGAWLAEHPEAARKNLEPVRDTVLLDPGVYYNRGTGMVDRLYTPQHAALGHQMFRVSTDPGAPFEEIRRRVLEGK